MSNTNSSRRRFIKTATAGATGLALSSSVLSAPPIATVNISFDGMMVFHKLDDLYEVGIVDKSIAIGHKLSFTKNGETLPLFTDILSKQRAQSSSNILQLDIKKRGRLKRDLKSTKEGHKNRLQDDLDGQLDFNWIADLESSEFHNKELTLIPGKFTFILRLSSGQLYTKYKIAKLTRTLGTNPTRSDWGFLTETVGCQIILKPHEELVASFSGQEVPVVKYKAGETTDIKIENVIPILDRPKTSHFHHYYCLFSGIDAAHQYEIQLKYPSELPHNHYPLHDPTRPGPRTIGDYPCGGVFLGKRKQALE